MVWPSCCLAYSVNTAFTELCHVRDSIPFFHYSLVIARNPVFVTVSPCFQEIIVYVCIQEPSVTFETMTNEVVKNTEGPSTMA